MADDKSKQDFRDRDRVSAEDDYEVSYFASKFNLSTDEVRSLIKRYGNDRETWSIKPALSRRRPRQGHGTRIRASTR